MIQQMIFASRSALDCFCRGGVVGGADYAQRFHLHGKKLKFELPAVAEVTFDDPQGQGLTASQIQTQLQAETMLVRVITCGGQLGFIEVTPALGVKLDVTGTPAEEARPLLGFPKTGVVRGSILSGVGGPGPSLISLAQEGGHWVLVYEDGVGNSRLSNLAPSQSDQSIDNPAAGHTAVSPPSRGVYIGGDGNLVVHKVANAAGTYTTYVGLKAGTMLPICVDEVRSSTTATNLVLEK